MNALTIDFGVHRRPIAYVFGFALLIPALAGAGYLTWRSLQLQDALARWQADWQRLSGMTTEVRPMDTREQRERLQTELHFANQVIDKLDTPWDALFGAVENAYHDQAILLSVEPDTERREVQLTAEAKDMASMLAYFRQVRQSPILQGAYLASHQINQQDPQKPVRFVIRAPWGGQDRGGESVEPPSQQVSLPVPAVTSPSIAARAELPAGKP